MWKLALLKATTAASTVVPYLPSWCKSKAWHSEQKNNNFYQTGPSWAQSLFPWLRKWWLWANLSALCFALHPFYTSPPLALQCMDDFFLWSECRPTCCTEASWEITSCPMMGLSFWMTSVHFIINISQMMDVSTCNYTRVYLQYKETETTFCNLLNLGYYFLEILL